MVKQLVFILVVFPFTDYDNLRVRNVRFKYIGKEFATVAWDTPIWRPLQHLITYNITLILNRAGWEAHQYRQVAHGPLEVTFNSLSLGDVEQLGATIEVTVNGASNAIEKVWTTRKLQTLFIEIRILTPRT